MHALYPSYCQRIADCVFMCIQAGSFGERQKNKQTNAEKYIIETPFTSLIVVSLLDHGSSLRLVLKAHKKCLSNQLPVPSVLAPVKLYYI